VKQHIIILWRAAVWWSVSFGHSIDWFSFIHCS